MTSTFLLLALCLLCCFGCRSSESQDRADLAAMRQEIQRVLGTPACSDSLSCAVIGLGVKPCGGPWEYLVVSRTSTDTTALFLRVRQYDSLEAGFNHKWGWVSDCSPARMPRVGCREGVCVDLDRP